jgi:MFS family permease
MTSANPLAQSVSPRPPRADTFSALRNSNFRLYFAGQLVSTAGTWMQNVAQAVLVVALIIKLTHSAEQSSLWLGIVACAAGLPLVLLSPLTGVIVERVPRRQLMLMTQTVQMLLAFILAALAFADLVQVWQVVLLAFLLGITNAVDQPSRQAFIVEMVGRKEM